MNYTKSTKWDSAYSVGHEKIDNEHKRLFEIATEINDSKNDLDKVISLIKELIKYTKLHFNNEEIYMKSIAYEGLDNHILIHRRISSELTEIASRVNTLDLNSIIKIIKDFIYDNVLLHILQEDKKVHHLKKDSNELKKYFKWKDDYKINENMIDSEHHKLFDIAEKAINYHDNDVRNHIKVTVNELYDYMKTHFQHEEDLMKEVNYPELKAHAILHENIIEQMNEFIKSIPNLNIEDYERKLIEYMDIWLINHILFEDRKLLSYMKEEES